MGEIKREEGKIFANSDCSIFVPVNSAMCGFNNSSECAHSLPLFLKKPVDGGKDTWLNEFLRMWRKEGQKMRFHLHSMGLKRSSGGNRTRTAFCDV